ncbi:dihydrofolate reductase family protein [Sorangium sp. So ce1097]|uniref:dihydrofolate reductase family protein n=1 Tax=Sorangium sp. So ce1097 TaxID=3133330 RepID=UPI003F5EA4C8
MLVGLRTVQIDDPRLTVRACAGPQPLRVVLASALGVPEGARLLVPPGSASSSQHEPRGRAPVRGAAHVGRHRRRGARGDRAGGAGALSRHSCAARALRRTHRLARTKASNRASWMPSASGV